MTQFRATIEPGIEIWLCAPTPFVAEHQQQLLPSWEVAIATSLILLQQSPFSLLETNPQIEREKGRLRERFLRLAFPLVCEWRDRGILSDLIDPRSGYPLLSPPGDLCHDDVAAVSAGLGFPTIAAGHCRAIVHPHWDTKVYPGIVLSSTPPDLLWHWIDRHLNLGLETAVRVD